MPFFVFRWRGLLRHHARAFPNSPMIGGGVFTGQRDGNGIFRAVGKGDECDGPLLLRRRLREGCASIALRKMRSICLSLFFLLFFSYLF